MHDLLHGALHFEGKLWNTLPMLALRPGQLTRRYIDGERARFVSPMALFLFGVFAMFAVFSVAGITAPTSLEREDDSFIAGFNEGFADDAAGAGGEVTTPAEGLAQLREERAGLTERIAALPEGDHARVRLVEERAGIDQAIAIIALPGRVTGNADETPGDTPANDLERVAEQGTGIELVDKIAHKWEENPGLMVYKLQSSAYKFSWLLIPISIPFEWLLFAWRRRFGAYDHAIFVTYSLAFMTLLFIVFSVVQGLLGLSELAFLGLLLIPPIHLYKQLRGAYDLSRFSAFWRLLMLSAFIWIIVALFMQLLLLLGAF